MIRVSFNGGELSPSSAMRFDLDVFHRGASCIENFDVAQMGGLTRRRGMRPVVGALAGSRLFPYVYSTVERYLVEVSPVSVRVLDVEGGIVASFASLWVEPELVRGKQINDLLIFTSPAVHPMVLSRSSGGGFALKRYELRNGPWRENEPQEEVVVAARTSETVFAVSGIGSMGAAGDVLRVSCMTDTVEARCLRADVFNNPAIGITFIMEFYQPVPIKAGSRLGIRSERFSDIYSCVAKWTGGTDFVNGLDHPVNYPSNFQRADSTGYYDVAQPVNRLTKDMTFEKGATVAVDSGYYELYTCIKDVSVTEGMKPDEMPDYFVRGIAIGGALPCRGTWQFYCSGTWYGEYEVRRSYDGGAVTDRSWESLGKSFSQLGAASNKQLTGDEFGEECWLRLWMNRIKFTATAIDGFPPDTCTNRLIVSPYKHHLLLRKGEAGFEYTNKIKLARYGTVTTKDWSWHAFSSLCKYPALCDVYNQRLVFAATEAQPQTVWMSKVDDINNFDLGSHDDSGVALTMSTTTQNRICWIMSQSSRLLLGTADAEWVISGGNGVLTYASARIDNHGYVGSADVPAIMATDKVVYCERGGGRLYQFGYDYQSDAYVSRDLTVFADHVLTQGGGVVDGCFLRKPDPRGVFVLADGTMALMTYNAMHEVNAWHRYTTAGRVVSCTSLPNGTHADSLFLVVERGGERVIEVIDSDSGYEDGGGLDYTSTVLTNALSVVDHAGRRRHASEVRVYLATECLVQGVEVSNDGVVWVPLDRSPGEVLPEGWLDVVADGAWVDDSRVGLRVTGKRGFELLAVEG